MVKNKSQHQIKLCPWAGGEKKNYHLIGILADDS